MPISFRCRCGTLQGEIDPRDVYVRATCYCRDCQAFARVLGRGDEILDPQGGTDILAMLPAGLRLTAGSAQLACLSLGPRGLLRWHSTCCDTPIANMPRDPERPFLGLLVHCVAGGAGALDATFGPSRLALHADAARGVIAPAPLRTRLGRLRILWGMFLARLRGRHRDHPFFRPGTRQPLVEPRVLTKEERARVSIATR